MAKILFDATTGTVIGTTHNVYIVDTDDLASELSVDTETAVDWLCDELTEAQDVAVAQGAHLVNILAIAGQND